MLGSIVAGAGGFMFLGVPLLWFFIGRELADRRLVLSILYGVVAVAVAIGAYGLWQTQVGIPVMGHGLGRPERLPGAQRVRGHEGVRHLLEQRRVRDLPGRGGGDLRGDAGPARRGVFALAIPLLAVPLFLAAGRGVVVLAVLAALVAVGLRTRNTRTWPLVIVSSGSWQPLWAVRSSLPRPAIRPLRHEPLVCPPGGRPHESARPEHSTLLTHVDLVVGGFEEGVLHPFGQGTAVTNIAADRFGIGSRTKGTEVDVSNAFVSLGLVGGLLFVALVIGDASAHAIDVLPASP